MLRLARGSPHLLAATTLQRTQVGWSRLTTTIASARIVPATNGRIMAVNNFSSSTKGYKVVLKDKFLKKYESKKAPFGFNGLGELVYRRTYARKKPDGTNEEWCAELWR